MESSTANLLIVGVQLLGVGAAVAWRAAVKTAVRDYASDATRHGYAVRSSSADEAFVRFGDAEIGAVVHIEIVQRRTKHGTRDVEVITRHWHGQVELPESIGSITVVRGAPGRFRRAPIVIGAGLTANVLDGPSAALVDDAVKAAILALNTDARLTSLTLGGTVLHASWRRTSTSLRLGKALGARLEDVAQALLAARARAGVVDDTYLPPPSSLVTPSIVGRVLESFTTSPYNRELQRIEPMLRDARAAGHRLDERDGERGFVVVEPGSPDLFLAPTVDLDTGRLRRGYRLVADVGVDGAVDIGRSSAGYGAMERSIGGGLIARAHDAAGLDLLSPDVVTALRAVDDAAGIVSVGLKDQRLTVFVKRGAVDLARARAVAVVVHRLVNAVRHG